MAEQSGYAEQTPNRVELTIPVDVGVPAPVLWDAVTDWPGQSEWMLGTRVELTGGDGRSVGSTLRAVTGVGPLGVADTMEITEWTESADGPRRAVVRHTGRVVRGEGVFSVVELGPQRSRFVWSELLDLPLGPLGRAGWPLVRPAFRSGVEMSLRKMAEQTEARYRGGAGGMTSAPDDRGRCDWALSAPDYVAYHDDEWGHPLRGEHAMFERLTLEGFQSGLSWLVILRKREAFRAAFRRFDPEQVARFDDDDVARLLSDASIVRNRQKIEATIHNARRVADLDVPLDELLWSFAPDPEGRTRPARLDDVPAITPESTAMAKELKRRGLRFVGPTTCYALMQATGLVDDHVRYCWRADPHAGGPAPLRCVNAADT